MIIIVIGVFGTFYRANIKSLFCQKFQTLILLIVNATKEIS